VTNVSNVSDVSGASDGSDTFSHETGRTVSMKHDEGKKKHENSPLMAHGGYEKLRAYKVAEAVYDATVVFCDRFIDKRSRTHDQMVQAARSGTRNISEGSGAAATSKKSEILLTNVARASLSDELLKDYRSFLMQRGLPVWDKDSPAALAMRERLRHDVAPNLPPEQEERPRLTGLNGLTGFIAKADPEIAGNAMLCVVNQAAYLLRKLMERQGRDFVDHGGFTERLYEVRTQARAAGPNEALSCPLCGREMRRRKAGKGPNAGRAFWGCIGYPDCRGTLKLESGSTA
jgi:four helix bundle suffix protein